MKKCNTCKTIKPLDEFSWKNKKKNIRSSKCKECHREYAKTHYIDNKESYRNRAIRDREEQLKKTKNLIAELKKDGCVRCGEKRLHCLDFHHTDPDEKEWGIAQLSSRKKILEEVRKCVVMCKNCHADEHHRLRMGLDT